jgi:hypothetical protein
MGERAFVELVESSPQACIWYDAYASCPFNEPCEAMTMSILHASALE